MQSNFTINSEDDDTALSKCNFTDRKYLRHLIITALTNWKKNKNLDKK